VVALKIGLIGSSSQELSLPFNAERNINCYPVADKDGKEQASLYGTPGLQIFATAGVGPGRGGFTTAADGRVFFVSGFNLFEVMADKTTIVRGTLLTGTGIVLMEENGLQIAVSDGTYLYMFTYAGNVFTQVTDPDLPASVGTVCFIGGYFIVNQNGTGKFYISDLYNGLSWQSLKFATAESSPDNLLRAISITGQLWLQGSLTTEVWNNNGAVNFPFAKIPGSEMQQGLVGPYACASVDNTNIWVGQDRNGSFIVYRAQGFTPQRISTEPVELLLKKVTVPATLRIWTYQENGHTFLVITGGGMETSPCYDLSTQLWHERAYFDAQGLYEIHLGACNTQGFGRNLVIDRTNGNIYQMSEDFYSDNGDELVMDRIFTHISQENQPFRSFNLTVCFESGVGTQTGQGADPQCMLSMSNDGGRTWFGNQFKSIGRVGEYIRSCKFSCLGTARIRTYRIRITDPVKRAITGAYMNTVR
jgi:hypothetical protein